MSEVAVKMILSIRGHLCQFGQEPEPSQATGMVLVRCILAVVCHCFPPLLDVPTFAARCLHVRNDARDPSRERWKGCPVILPTCRLYLRH